MSRPGLRLLGDGVDAIVQRDPTRMPRRITPEMRLRRYALASALHPDRQHDLRRQIGLCFKDAWARGLTPRLAKFARVMQSIRRCTDHVGSG
ncbi:hypothetical protein [[Pseudomonas] boreopolis]|uniref:Uncharacterized protein n=1 Tax=Xanthomonas boreopolis TaxID=86183 RepID=A0A919F7V6_9XANT|nr:hypothetical protein GCM10009090_16190 [[Pseudomonas] boreopolis]